MTTAKSNDVEHVLQSVISDSITKIKDIWIDNAPDDVFYDYEYLLSVERNKPDHIIPYYGVCYLNEHVVGLLHFHTSQICLKENLRFDPLDKTIKTKLQNIVTNCINVHCTILGSTLITGNYGIHFIDGLSAADKTKFIDSALNELNKTLKSKGLKPGITVVKDFYINDNILPDHDTLKLIPFSVQPKMHLTIKEEWQTMDDYIQSLKSKYRVRYNKARSLLTKITTKEFQLDDITSNRDVIHSMYKNVSDNAGFNAFVLHPRYFEGLKDALGDKCRFFTYWKDGKMIAFYTAIYNGEVLDAHFLGYLPDENASHHLYLNMLLDLLELAINDRKSLLDLSRTAIEIKSTIGAVPQEMKLFIRHENKWVNKFTEQIMGFIKPKADYIIRSPFKE